MFQRLCLSLLAPFCLALVVVAGASGQEDDAKPPRLKLNLPGQLGFGGSGDGQEVTFTAGFQVEKSSGKGKIYIKADITSGWHIYSLTQPPGAAQPSELKVEAGKGVKVGQFSPDVQPHAYFSSAFNAQVEEHTGTVVWTAPLELPAGADAKAATIAIRYSGQVCDDSAGRCIPVDEKLTAKFDGYLEPAGTPGEYRPKTANLVWRGHVEPKVVTPGSKAKLIFTATPDEHWHLYPYAPTGASDQIAKPTLVVLSNSAGWKKSAVAVSKEPISGPALTPGEPAQRYYEGEVTFTIELTVPATAQPGEATLSGFLGFQTCDANSCKPPSGAKFSVSVPIGSAEQAGKLPLAFEPVGYKRVAEVAASQPVTAETLTAAWVFAIVGLSLLGGLVLNLMPCVLPVLGLKVMSFVKQGGHSRGRIIGLNLAYTAGLLVVFLFLATLSAVFNLGWGAHMGALWFRITMLVAMFAFGLSFLGVWEMTIPGVGGSEAVGATQAREGLPGAFFKGMFTTILGVSCSGPFLGALFGYTLTLPWYMTYLIFICVGLGMASPFLLIGTVPSLQVLIPKPGEWMNTFKHLMGFAMMGVVIWVLSWFADSYIAALTLLVGVAFACWWIGRVPVFEDLDKQIRAWAIGVTAAVAIGCGGFYFLAPVPELYEWRKFDDAALKQLHASNKTVMLDFTADWCANCQINYRFAINTNAVKEVVEKNGVIAVKADWTNYPPGVTQKLHELSSNSIPVLAIYPAGKPDEVIILRDLVTQKQVLDALQKAGPSGSAASDVAGDVSESCVAKVSSGD